MLEIKNTITEMKNAFDGLLSKLDSQVKNQWAWRGVNRDFPSQNAERKKENIKTSTKWPKQNIQGVWNNFKRSNTCIIGAPEGEREWRRNIWSSNSWELSKVNDRYQTTDAEILENIKTFWYLHQHVSYSNIRRLKTQRKSWGKPEGKATLLPEGQGKRNKIK